LDFSNFVDAMGTFTGLSRQAGLFDEHGNFPRLKAALVVEGVGAAAGGAVSASSNTVFIESGAGIGEGARTGLASLVTGGLFLAAMFLTPLAEIVPSEVAAAALVVVGTMMVSVSASSPGWCFAPRLARSARSARCCGSYLSGLCCTSRADGSTR